MSDDTIFWLITIPAIIWIGYIFLTKRGRGTMFGGRIIKTYGGVKARRKGGSNSVEVHVIDDGSVKFVGMELKVMTLGNYQMLPISLPETEARQLANLITEACNYREGT